MADVQKLADAAEVIVQGYAFIDRGEGDRHRQGRTALLRRLRPQRHVESGRRQSNKG